MPDRERIDPGSSKRYARRDERGRFSSDQVEVGRSLSKDRQMKAKNPTRKGQGDRGDRRTP